MPKHARRAFRRLRCAQATVFRYPILLFINARAADGHNDVRSNHLLIALFREQKVNFLFSAITPFTCTDARGVAREHRARMAAATFCHRVHERIVVGNV